VSPLLTRIPARAKGKERRKYLAHERRFIRSDPLLESGELPDGFALRNLCFL
jgi:hypothetical protein